MILSELLLEVLFVVARANSLFCVFDLIKMTLNDLE